MLDIGRKPQYLALMAPSPELQLLHCSASYCCESAFTDPTSSNLVNILETGGDSRDELTPNLCWGKIIFYDNTLCFFSLHLFYRERGDQVVKTQARQASRSVALRHGQGSWARAWSRSLRAACLQGTRLGQGNCQL